MGTSWLMGNIVYLEGLIKSSKKSISPEKLFMVIVAVLIQRKQLKMSDVMSGIFIIFCYI